MQTWTNVNHSSVSQVFKDMLDNKTNFITYDFTYNGLPLTLLCSLETRNEEQ